MAYKLSARSQSSLSGVHPDLIKVVMRAIEITQTDFTILEGLRTRETQVKYVKKGASKTMNSKHLKQPDGYGHAVDLGPLVNGQVTWEWGKPYDDVSSAMKQAAEDLNIKIQWGGDWKTFKDGPHYELVKK